MTIDNTPLQIAKEDGEAKEAARRAPLRHATTGASNTIEFARMSAKIVLRGAREIMDEDDVRAIKERMATWVNYIRSYERDVSEAKRSIAPDDLPALLAMMYRTREDYREELFP